MFTTEEYRILVAISDFLILKLDSAGFVVACSEPTAKILGYDSSELVGLNWFDACLPSSARESVRCMFSGIMSGKIDPVEKYDNEVLTRSGDSRFFSFANSWCRDSNGKIVGVLSSGFDVTSAHIARQEANAFENRLESLFRIAKLRSPTVKDLLDHTIQEAISLTGSSMGYIYFYDEEKQEFTLNSRAGKMMDECSVAGNNTRYSLAATGLWGEVVRQRKSILVNDYAAPNAHIKGLPKGHVPLRRFLTVPVFSADKIVAVVGVANKEVPYDDSDERQLLLLMKQAWSVVEEQEKHNSEVEFRERLCQSDKLAFVGTMAASIAHEIKSPISVMALVCDEFREFLKQEENRGSVLADCLLPFEKSVESLMGLSQNLTSFCRQGKLVDVEAKVWDLHELLSENYPLLKTLVKKSRVLVTTEFCAEKIFVSVNAQEFQQVFLNLVKNACDAMEHQDGVREIRISTECREDKVAICFHDSGPGVPSAAADKIFDKFFTTKPDGLGTGLGLFICRDIVQRSGGELRLRPTSLGACFEIMMPRNTASR